MKTALTDKKNVFIDLSKLSEDKLKSLVPILENAGYHVYFEDRMFLKHGNYHKPYFHLLNNKSWMSSLFLVMKTELTYPEFIKLFDGGEGEESIEHICKYCGCLTTQPDSDCYAKPKNTMETLYRKVAVRKPNEEGVYDTSRGLLSFSKTFGWVTIQNYTTPQPEYWYEEIPDPTAQLQADKAEMVRMLERCENRILPTENHSSLLRDLNELIQKHKQ